MPLNALVHVSAGSKPMLNKRKEKEDRVYAMHVQFKLS